MKRMKRVVALIGAVLMTALTPASALAASGGYVPTAGKYYTYDSDGNGQWTQWETFKISYKKDGRPTKLTTVWPEGQSSAVTYSWKGNLLKKRNGYGSVTTYKYKNGLLKSFAISGIKGTEKGTYTWKKKKASVKASATQKMAAPQSWKVKINSKKQLILDEEKWDGIVTKTTIKYHANGNIKSITTSSTGSGALQSKETYNKTGYITSRIYSIDGTKQSTTFRYKMDKKKKCPKEVEITTNVGGPDPYIIMDKIEFTSFKKVSRIRNCDAFGHQVPLGYSH